MKLNGWGFVANSVYKKCSEIWNKNIRHLFLTVNIRLPRAKEIKTT